MKVYLINEDFQIRDKIFLKAKKKKLSFVMIRSFDFILRLNRKIIFRPIAEMVVIECKEQKRRPITMPTSYAKMPPPSDI